MVEDFWFCQGKILRHSIATARSFNEDRGKKIKHKIRKLKWDRYNNGAVSFSYNWLQNEEVLKNYFYLSEKQVLMSIAEKIYSLHRNRKKGLIVLIDPDKSDPEKALKIAQKANSVGVELIFIGGSLVLNLDNFREIIIRLKGSGNIPVVLFPGSIYQVDPNADAILFLSLISGRNPDLLISRHVEAAQMVKSSGLEVLPTGYMLINSGQATSVHYMSHSLPIPANKPDIAASTALAGEMLGLKLIYLEAGSGAQNPVPPELISGVERAIEIPLIVGGGIRTENDAEAAFQAGADLIVIGTAMEEEGNAEFLENLSKVVDRINKE